MKQSRSFHTLLPLLILAIVWIASPTAAFEGEEDCAKCHNDQATQQAKSVHANLSCKDCHDRTSAYMSSLGELQSATASDGDTGGMHDHGEGFVGKMARHDVPKLCGTCHADVARMNPFGLRTDQLSRYRTSVHGVTLEKKGDDRVAVCIDCHGVHDILSHKEPSSRTYPLNIPDTCAHCHADEKLMSNYDIPTAIVDEYRHSVHGKLLTEKGDTGAPTCATCHGNHSAVPPGFASVGAVCGKCHVDAREAFAGTAHAEQEEFHGCVQCHGGEEGGHRHLITRVTQPANTLVDRYEELQKMANPTEEAEALSKLLGSPKHLINQAMHGCTECHEDVEDDESLQALMSMFDELVDGEKEFLQTAARLDEAGKGILLVDEQRFKFEEAKTQLIHLASLQHTLDHEKLTAAIGNMHSVCENVQSDIDGLELGLTRRRVALLPIWLFAVLFSAALYVKYKQLKHRYVKSS